VSEAGPGPAAVARVVVDLPVPRVFSYLIPPDLAGRVAPGQRVRVPFHGRPRAGVVVELAAEPPAALRQLAGALDPVPALSPPLLALTRWAAAETATAWGDAVARAIPPPAPSAAPPALPPDGPLAPPVQPVIGYGPGRARLVETAVVRAGEADGGVLVLAPEIETARAWLPRLDRLATGGVALVTSDASPRERWATWWAFRQGHRRVALGTRAAAFWPVRGLAATIVLDEHEAAHKALDTPRWHARELALQRSRLEGGACLLVSATPSLESWARIRAGAAVAEEAKEDRWPDVHRVDLRAAPPPSGLLTPPLGEAVRATLDAGRSVVLVLNRLGYGRALGCAECGAVRRCARCRVALTYHLRGRLLACRLCGERQPASSQCGRCRGRRLQPLGWGTERLEVEARAAFPGARVARYDSTLSAPRAMAVREAFRGGVVRLVVGTSMAVRLCAEAPVGLAALVLADATLQVPDFRAAERTFQLAWHLAEGVAPGGSLWLQSFFPDHRALAAVAEGAHERFYEPEWAERQELGYPPARRMARLVLSGVEAARLIGDLAERCRGAGVEVLGPSELAGRRLQLLLQGGDELPGAVARALEPFRGHRRLRGARLLVDVDPVELP
jgi:primosomal protein N' (replication factor Y)